MIDPMQPCPHCGQTVWTYRTKTHQDLDGASFSGPEFLVGHMRGGTNCPGSHVPVAQLHTKETRN